MLLSTPLIALLAIASGSGPSEAEVRIVEYLREHVTPGRPVVVSDLYNRVFTSPEERAVLERLFDTFFRIPLFTAQFQQAMGKPPSLKEIGEQFRFTVPGQTDVMLRIMEADPRLPRFMERDAATGELSRVDVAAILADPRFSRLIDRTIAGFEGRLAPRFALTAFDGSSIGSEELSGKPYLIYFWFTGCPPCLATTPTLVELHRTYREKGLEILGVNADRVLEVPADDGERAAYARESGIAFRLAHMTPEMQAAYGQVSVFPTLFFVDSSGTIVKHFVSAQPRAVLEEAVRQILR